MRHPQKRDVYIMSGYMAPALVKSSDDLIEYYVEDSSTVDPNAKKGCKCALLVENLQVLFACAC